MKPARLIAILAMVAVLGVLVAIPALLVGAFSYGVRHMDQVVGDMNGEWETKGLPVKFGQNELTKGFQTISQAGPMDIVWVRDAKPGFVVSGPTENVALIRYQHDGSSLKFGCARGKWKVCPEKVKIVVHGPQPVNVSIAGSGDLIAKDLQGGDFDFSLAGSGDAILSGNIESLDVSIAGSGDIVAKDLKCERSSISIAGSGNIDITASEKLDVSIAGSGDITYYGDPAVEKSVFGSGRVHKG